MSDAVGVRLGIEGLSDAVRVGQGSYGVVYRASQAAYGRTVAVKILTSPLLDDDSRRRFERECRALGSLSSHPNIVTLHAAGATDDDRPYLIMDYLPGGSLAARVAGGPLDWRQVTDIGVKLAGALAAAHEQSILHRDIKPENILISAYGEPQLADFGVAKIQGGTATTTGTITGSLAHAAPEVISGVQATVASDMWSLASTLATLVAGHPPFYRSDDETLTPLITRILTQPPQDLRPLGVPDELCQLLEDWPGQGLLGATADSPGLRPFAAGGPAHLGLACHRNGRHRRRDRRSIPAIGGVHRIPHADAARGRHRGSRRG